MGNEYGAAIERGKVVGLENGRYIVESLTREGIITPPMEAMDGQTYQAGDTVYFFMFDDGQGRIVTG